MADAVERALAAMNKLETDVATANFRKSSLIDEGGLTSFEQAGLTAGEMYGGPGGSDDEAAKENTQEDAGSKPGYEGKYDTASSDVRTGK